MYGGAKVARILANYNIDMDEFVEYYDKLPRKLDLWKAPDEYEIAAVESFLQHHDLQELCHDLDVTQQSAFKVITRYLVWSHEQQEEEEDDYEESENGTAVNGHHSPVDEGVPVSV